MIVGCFEKKITHRHRWQKETSAKMQATQKGQKTED